jgi:nucleotide-binding universal stress UspA family protein
VIEIESGLRIDGFVVGECIHGGAMGRVFRVTREGDPAPLAMKVPRLGTGDSTELLLGFETEAMILPALRTRYAPRFIAAGDIRTSPYLVTEWVEGESLARRVGTPQPAKEVARIGATIADGLRTLHAQGVIHLDLKPDNVILRPDGIAVIVDFGLAHHRRLPDLLAEEMRYAAGSAPYISPEQVMGIRSDDRSDLFALGVMLYELATARLPFGTPATLAGYRDRLWLDPKPPRARVPDVPPWLQEVILRLIEPEAARRYQSAGHVAWDLRHPDQVPLTDRAARSAQAGFFSQVRRWWRARIAPLQAQAHGTETAKAASAHAVAPVVMIAIDTSHPEDERHPFLQRAARRILELSEEFRVVCVSVISAGPGPGGDGESDAVVEHRVRLRNWVQPLGLPPQRLTLHVLEASDPADALLDFAKRNNVDLIVLGAPAPSEMALAWWRSVASSVTANAPCSVHVVRVPADARD